MPYRQNGFRGDNVSGLVERKWLDAPLNWQEHGAASRVSREDVIVFLGRALPRRTRTLMAGVRRVPPGHRIKRPSSNTFVLERTWSALPSGDFPRISEGELAAELRRLLPRVLKAQSEARKVGVLLSGGFDSALITILLSQMGIVPHCYTVVPEPHGPLIKEWKFACAIAEWVKAPIRCVTVTLQDVLRTSKELLQVTRKPHVCWVIANQFVGARAAKEDGCDLLMLGLGSDELFGPYQGEAAKAWRFDELALEIGEKEVWERTLCSDSSARSETFYLGNISSSAFQPDLLGRLFPDVDVTTLLETDVLELLRELHELSPTSPIGTLFLQLELELRSSDILMYELNAAAALAGMTVAYPFYDKAVVELAAKVPLSLKSLRSDVAGSTGSNTVDWKKVVDKHILRVAFQEVMPRAVHLRARGARRAYTLPIGWWMRNGIRRNLESTILECSAWEQFGVQSDVLTECTITLLDNLEDRGAALRFWLLYQIASWWQASISG